MKHSVAITGVGVVSPLGLNHEIFFDALMSKTSGLKLLDPQLSNGVPTIAGIVDFDPNTWISKPQLSGIDRVSQFAIAAAEMAVADAKPKTSDFEKAGCYFGCGMGGANSLEQAYAAHFSEHPRFSPLTVIASMTNAPAAHLAMRFGIHGPVLTYSVACASSSVAIGEAFRAISSGALTHALVGGAESILVSGVIRAWQFMRTLAQVDISSPETSCRPFALDRSGLVLSEGAAVLYLERTDLAKARGAKIYAEIIGYGLSCDANHIAKPDSSGQVRALRSALQDAHLQPHEIGYINAHGTATKVGDSVECASLNEVWGADMSQTKVSSTKSMHGHLLGASGALESVICAMSLYKGQMPPNAFCKKQDSECKVSLVLEKSEPDFNLKIALNNSFAFGGTNAVLAFRRVSDREIN